jgi:hypothetical protein
MTVKDAYERVKELPDNNFLIECLDFGDFWGFWFNFKPCDPGDTGVMLSCGFDTVNKQTGEISHLTPAMNHERFENAKSVPVEEFAGALSVAGR